MKKTLVLILSICMLLSCKHNGTKTEPSNKPEQQGQIEAGITEKSEMVTVITAAVTVQGQKKLPYVPNSPVTFFIDGVFVPARTVTLKPYKIGKYEVTYELWHKVITWAKTNGYQFQFQGVGGSITADNGNKDCPLPTEETKHLPVVRIPWRSAVVWCNAYSEMTKKKCVYYSDAAMTQPLRSTKLPNAPDPDYAYNFKADDRAGSTDNPFVDWNADGFRLPTEAEWEFAARGGNTAVPEWLFRYAETDSDAELSKYAWIKNPETGDKTHPVGKKLPNKLGLYDLCGNVTEFCWDWLTEDVSNLDYTGPVQRPQTEKPEHSRRMVKGNSFATEAPGIGDFWLTFRSGYSIVHGDQYAGFRLAATIKQKQ